MTVAPPFADQRIAKVFFERNLVLPGNFIDDEESEIMPRALVPAGIPQTHDELHGSIPENPDEGAASGLLATFLLLFLYLGSNRRCLHWRRGRGRSLFNRRRDNGDQSEVEFRDHGYALRDRQFFDMNGIPYIERAHLDVEEFRDIQRQTLHLDLSNNGLQNTTANNARCFTDKVKRRAGSGFSP